MMSATNNQPVYLTCITCRLAFKDAELQRLHYKTEWHRYNLKRKVVNLPPVTLNDYQQKMSKETTENEERQKDKRVYCEPCQKLFANVNAYDNHLNSKKHKNNDKIYVDRADNMEIKSLKKDLVNSAQVKNEDIIEELDSDEWDEDTVNPIDNDECLFCPHQSKNFFKNLEHMTIVHSFFIPDIEFCTDVQGLLRYLGEKVTNGYMCLWCNESGRAFRSAEAAKSHMVDKGHCRMLHEGVTLAEYVDYYDYSTSYPDVKDDMDVDEEVDVSHLDNSEYELVLPSGVKVGHRSLMRYYKQSSTRTTAVALSRNTKKLHKTLATYRALGWTQADQEQAARKARDIQYMKRMHSKYMAKLGVKNNKLLQTHFRQQVNF